MSSLHYELMNKYTKYEIISTDVRLEKYNYLFNVIASLNSNSKIIIGGTHIVLGTYNTEKNIFAWADNSNVLDRGIVEEIRNIRSRLLESAKSDKYLEYAGNDILIMTTDEITKMLNSISEALKIDIILNIRNNIQHIHMIRKILVDNR